MKDRLKRLFLKICVKLRLAAVKAMGKSSITIKLKAGPILAVRVNDWTGREILNNESFEDFYRTKILEQAKPNMVVLDIGANIGYYTVQLAAQVGPGGRVIAFDPNPVMVAELQKNIALNRLANVTVQPFALSNQRGEVEFFCPPPGREAHGSLQPNATFDVTHVIKIPTRTLDEVLQELGLAAVDFIKIDAEGAERGIFQGAHLLFSGPQPPVIFFECAEAACQPFGHHVFDVLQDLARYGYVIEQIDFGNWAARPNRRP